MVGTIQNYTLDMADGTAPKPLIVKQGDTNSRQAQILLKAFNQPWTIPFGCQIQINVRKNDGTYANATCTQEDEHTVLAPITEQMTAVSGTHLGELFFLGSDGDIRSQTFPLVAWDAVTDLDLMASANDFQTLKDALRDVKISTDAASIATQYATEQGNSARDAAQRAEDAAASIQVAVDAAAAAKACESNAKDSELATARTQQAVTDYVEAQKAAFVGYSKRESDSRYANALTNSVTGEGGVTVEDAWTAPVLGLNVAGKSEQVVTTGAQLLDSSKIVIGGLSGDKGAEFETQARVRTGYISVTEGDVYKLSGYAPYVVHNAFVYGADKTMTGAYNSGSAVPQNAAYARISLKKSDEGNFTVDDLATLKKSLMFNAGSAVLPYEPYTGGAPSPSPDYPQDIISTGTVSTGAQLLPLPESSSGTVAGITYRAESGYLILNGTPAGSDVTMRDIYFCGTYDQYVDVGFPVGEVTLSAYGLPSGVAVMVVKSDGNIVAFINNATPEKKFTHAEGDKYRIMCRVSVNGITISNYTLKAMLNAGDTALPWEPYTGGKLSPSVEYPQTLEVGVTGAQLLDLPDVTGTLSGIKYTFKGGEVAVTGTPNSQYANIYWARLTLSPGNYYISGGNVSAGNMYAQVSIDKDGATERYVNKAFSVTGDETAISLTIQSSASTAPISYTFKPMLNSGEAPLPWEPYQSATASITLTEPLRGIEDYRDRIECRDGVWGIERWLYRVDYDGSEDEVWSIQSVNDKGITNYTISLKAIAKKNIKGVLCTCLQYDSSWIADATRNGIIIDSGSSLYIRLKEVKTVEALKTWLSGNPVTAIYPLAAPTWDPLPDATQQALNELTTYAGTTHLTITAGGPAAEVTLDYVQDTHKALEQCQEAAKEYTDNQLATIVAALPTATQAAIVDNQTTRLLQEV